MIRFADRSRGGRLRAAAAFLAAPLALSATAAGAQPVVQALPDPAQARLNESLRILAQDPHSLTGLLGAGQAALALDDANTALGFFRRAEVVSPLHGGVKAGLASVLARQGQPAEALRLFAEAEAAGEPMAAYAGDRGLAYDLVGDNARAQQDYKLALTQGENALISRRLALSQAIAGDQLSSEATLLPLLQRQDLAAYRTRAFALAILGKSEEAVSIAQTMLPERVSGRLAPYLRYMPRLTRAQQAAAANLGTFPRAAEIGRDDPALAAYGPQGGANAPQPARTADARLMPAGEPLGPNRVAPAPVSNQPAPTPPVQAAVAPLPAPVAPTPTPVASAPTPVAAGPAPVLVAQMPPPAAPSPQLATTTVPQPLPPVSSPVVVAAATPPTTLPPTTMQAPTPTPTPLSQVPPPTTQPPAAAPPPPPPVSLSEAFADFSLPTRSVAAGEGAVDITTIEPRREPPPQAAKPAVPAKPAPPPKPVVPSRQWVQVATGRDPKALEFDWRRIKRSGGTVLAKSAPHIAAWGQTNRLVVGPFASVKEANDMVAKLKEKEIDSFRFTSAQGEEVKPLD